MTRRGSEREALAKLSARLGRDPAQVQAAGGNTSVKEDANGRRVLRVKASGLWLEDALARDIFVGLDLEGILAGIREGRADPVAGTAIAEENGLRPSIETTLHALLPHRVVLHTHSVRTIALAIREDAEAHIDVRLAGLAHAFIPYAMPGLPLTGAVHRRLEAAGSAPDVLVLGNHGLVVGGDDVEAAATLLEEVERRMEAPTLMERAAWSVEPMAGLRPVADPHAHSLAFDGPRARLAASGTFYPDHAIFLGPAARLDAAPEGGADLRSKLSIVPGRGLYLGADCGPAADAMALCLADVFSRVPEGAPLKSLAKADEDALLGWEAETYRQGLARVAPP